MEAVSLKTVLLNPVPLTPLNFSPYGQVIGPSPDGALFGPQDAQLQLTAGTPRFYIMRIEDRPLTFGRITHHAKVTQCLGSVGALPWYIGVAKPSIVESNEDGNAVKSHAGHYYIPPSPSDVQLFRIEGPQFVKFHAGTWHAGPYFKGKMMDFYNLELSDTNEVDHTVHDFVQNNNVQFEIDE